MRPLDCDSTHRTNIAMAVLSPFCLLLAQAAASTRARDLDEWHAPDAASIATWVNSDAISDAVPDERGDPEDYLWPNSPRPLLSKQKSTW